MLSERPYRRALEFSAALDQVHKGRGSQFDPDLADLFLNLLEQGKVAF
jgi:HD-GYP domain-containing protein (c-di-GMP phosphodiesterase class II)